MVCCHNKLREKHYLNDPGLMKRYVRIKAFDVKLLLNILTLLLLLGLDRIKLLFLIIIISFITIIIIIIIIITIIKVTLMPLLVYIRHHLPRFEIFQNSLNKKQNE